MVTMKNRIHIAPVGFEIDRIVLPAIKLKADMVYLIVHQNTNEDKALKYIAEVKRKLELKDIKVEIAYVDRLKLFEIIRIVKEIIDKDKKADYYINVASGSKIHAIALMMSCMIYNNKGNSMTPIYPQPEKYTEYKNIREQQTYGLTEIIELRPYELITPSEDLLKTLTIIKKCRENRGIKKQNLAIEAEKAGILNTEAKDKERARLSSLDKKIIKPLLNTWHFIEETKIGKNRYITLSKDGESAAEFLF